MRAGRIEAIIGAGLAAAAAFFVAGADSPTRAARPTVVPAALTARAAGLAKVAPGLWLLSPVDKGGVPRRLCVEDAASLIQLAHPGADCGHVNIEDGPTQVTVSYDCAAGGGGRTTLKIRGGDTLRIETQGIADRQPFAWTMDARREGDCPR